MHTLLRPNEPGEYRLMTLVCTAMDPVHQVLDKPEACAGYAADPLLYVLAYEKGTFYAACAGVIDILFQNQASRSSPCCYTVSASSTLIWWIVCHDVPCLVQGAACGM
jgi:hypothetical protein